MWSLRPMVRADRATGYKPGVIKLAQVTGTPVLPLTATYSKAKRLRTWDKFFVPYPFSRVDVRVGPLQTIAPAGDDEAFERERLRIEAILGED